MDADNSFYIKFIATLLSTFFEYIISILAILYFKEYLREGAGSENDILACFHYCLQRGRGANVTENVLT